MDINGDGHLDILSGAYGDPSKSPFVGLFQVLYGNAKGGFEPAKTLLGTDDKPLIISNLPNITSGKKDAHGYCTRPFAVDWDKDGKLDLVVGEALGSFQFFKGEGAGKFAPKSEPMLSSSGKPLQLDGLAPTSDPFVFDWDGDGDLDILSGSACGNIYWSETSEKGSAPFKPLLNLFPGGENHFLRHTARVWADDLNGDGKPDLLIGQKAGNVWMYLQK